MTPRPFAFAACAGLLAACASLPAPTATTEIPTAVVAAPDHGRLKAIADAATPLEKDRLAILSMLGDYEVKFDFQETVVLAPGYTRKPTKTTGAFETVVLVEDSGRSLVLQHLLVSKDGGHVTKHWRQDWHFEAPTRLDFSEDQVWRIKPISPDITRGTWTQCVYEVSDAPRYCGTGKWNHRYGVATWTSDRTWRPLPRREYTTRSDYNALNVENRHTITPGGWTHEQDNTKTLRIGEHTAGILVREFGFNDYRRIAGFDFSPAHQYWSATQDYWTRVRTLWAERTIASAGLRLNYPVDSIAMIEAVFTQAEAVGNGQTIADAQIAEVFDRWVTAPDAGPALASRRVSRPPD